jgi:hypothetical protein
MGCFGSDSGHTEGIRHPRYVNIVAIGFRGVASLDANQNLEAAVNRGEFCNDLYLSLQVIFYRGAAARRA